MSRRRATVLALAAVAASALAVGWPLLAFGYNGNAHDAQYHSRWTLAFTQQMWEGELWPRWLTPLNEGLGSPTFFFYAPLPYWVSGLLRPLVGWQAADCWRVLGVSSFVALLASGLFMFAWLRSICPPWGAALGACLYVVAPYHLVDVYERGAFGETWALVWMPAVMGAAQAVAERRPRAVLLLALAYAALILTHLPTTLMFSAVPLAWAACRDRRTLAATAAAMALGAGLASAYLVPALCLRDAVTMDQLNPSAFARRFLLPAADGEAEAPPYREGLVRVGASTLVLALGGFLAGAAGPARRFWIGVAALAALMTTGWSVAVWRLVPVLQTVQFPWRFLAVLTLAAAALAGLASVGATRARALGGLAALALVGLWWAPMDARLAAMPREAGPRSAPDMRVDAPEYTTRGRRASLAMLHERVTRADGTTRPAVVFAFGSLDAVRHGARHYTFAVDVDQDAVMWVAQSWFPGWTATLDGKPWPVEHNVPMGVPQVRVPSGRHVVDVRLAATWPEVVGWVVTLASLSLAGLVALIASPRSRSDPRLAGPSR